ncbi:MAG: DNA cytosine methyltransferase [Actinomycetota bacterium]
MAELNSLEVCAGAGGQALGLEQAGFRHAACVEMDPHACKTLRHNRDWRVIEGDVRQLSGSKFKGIDLLAGGVPCPPFSVAGKQLGKADERDLFPEMVRLASEIQPRAVLIENVRGLRDPVFAGYRAHIEQEFEDLGYAVMGWQLLHASWFGVPQLRPRVAMVALKPEYVPFFAWPVGREGPAPTVGQALLHEMARDGWEGADAWSALASDIAPTLVGGSKKHGGPDLGPTRARQAWAKLGVDGRTLADNPPQPGHQGPVLLTVRMTAIIQGFDPSSWEIVGRKTQAYRQVGNAFPPPVARALGESIAAALEKRERTPAPDVPEVFEQEQLPVGVG